MCVLTQVSTSKKQELSGAGTFAADDFVPKDISAAKKAALFSSRIFDADEDSTVKQTQSSMLKQTHLEGSQSQAILTGSSLEIPSKRPIRGGTRTPGGGSSINLGGLS